MKHKIVWNIWFLVIKKEELFVSQILLKKKKREKLTSKEINQSEKISHPNKTCRNGIIFLKEPDMKCYHCWIMGNFLPSHLSLLSADRVEAALLCLQRMNLPVLRLMFSIWSLHDQRKASLYSGCRATTELWSQLCTTEVNWALVPEFRTRFYKPLGNYIRSALLEKGLFH